MTDRVEACVHGTRLILLQGDITEQAVEAIVNAANPQLSPGGGVSGAIHRVGGPTLTAAAAEIRARRGRLATGDAVITPGGQLPARWVIHTVGPVWRGGGREEDLLLAKAYQSCLALAGGRGIRQVAFPSISTGAYGFPVDRAAGVAVRAVLAFIADHPGRLEEVRWVLFSAPDLRAYGEAWRAQGLEG
ncbi:MAG: macro domain-containing protein [Candidatus Bipolaricaulaceae bacterium]